MNKFSFSELLAIRKASKAQEEATKGTTTTTATTASKPFGSTTTTSSLPPLPDLKCPPSGGRPAAEVAAIKKDVLRLR